MGNHPIDINYQWIDLHSLILAVYNNAKIQSNRPTKHKFYGRYT
jgi:hypothetical protein